jgi:hypothetical protein
MNYPENPSMKTFRSGRLGEAFCKEYFGISEPEYEIKSNDISHASFIVQACQLLFSLHKQYVFVGYKRKAETIKKGPRKGRRKFIETIEKAYEKKLKIYVVPGLWIIRVITREKLPLYSTNPKGQENKYGEWGFVWRIPTKFFPDTIYKDTARYTIFAYSMYPPYWTEGASIIQGGLFNEADKELIKPEIKEWETNDIIPF